MSDEAVSAGVGAGCMFAAIISFSIWKSFWWMVLHSMCGWAYIVYWAFKY
jgi:hypothetical protein